MRSRVLMVAVGVAVLAGVGAVVWWSQQLPQGPVPIVWDKEACAYCRMHVGDPHFAAQVQVEDGRVLSFDDPGCAFHWLEANAQAPLHAVYFHHWREERWLPMAEAAFVPASPTPMGFGLGAVPAGTPGALTVDEARAQAMRKTGGHGAGAEVHP